MTPKEVQWLLVKLDCFLRHCAMDAWQQHKQHGFFMFVFVHFWIVFKWFWFFFWSSSPKLTIPRWTLCLAFFRAAFICLQQKLRIVCPQFKYVIYFICVSFVSMRTMACFFLPCISLKLNCHNYFRIQIMQTVFCYPKVTLKNCWNKSIIFFGRSVELVCCWWSSISIAFKLTRLYCHTVKCHMQSCVCDVRWYVWDFRWAHCKILKQIKFHGISYFQFYSIFICGVAKMSGISAWMVIISVCCN